MWVLKEATQSLSSRIVAGKAGRQEEQFYQVEDIFLMISAIRKPGFQLGLGVFVVTACGFFKKQHGGV